MNTTPNQFSQDIGKNREFIRKIVGEIGSDVLRNINRIFPNINIMWIITGEGEKFLKNDITLSNNENLTSYLKEENKELKKQLNDK